LAHPGDSNRFGKYELVELLGEGGMARVYRAIHEGPMGFRKVVALKQLRPRKKKHEKRVRAFINEARLGGHLRHRNVVEVYEFGHEGKVYYISMEFVAGPSLADVLDRMPEKGPLPPRIVAQIALQMCAGLDYAHKAKDVDGRPLNLIHRDLKPANVMITRDATVKIADFGIARATSNIDRTTSGVAKGTPLYMSPEQVMGRPLDQRSDLFSLCAVIAQMITGRFVFEARKIDEIVKRVAKADVGDSLALVKERMPEMLPVLRRGFQRRPADRYQDARELGHSIRAVYRKLPGDDKLRPWLREWFPETNLDSDDLSLFSIGGYSSTSMSAPHEPARVESIKAPPPTVSPEVRTPTPAKLELSLPDPEGTTRAPPLPVPPTTTQGEQRRPGWHWIVGIGAPLLIVGLLLWGWLGGWFGGGDRGDAADDPATTADAGDLVSTLEPDPTPTEPSTPVVESATPDPEPVSEAAEAETPAPPEPVTEPPTPEPATPAPAGVTRGAEPLAEIHPTYPPASIRRGEEGSVLLRVEVLADGRAGRMELVRSSGHDRLDRAACDAVRTARFLPALANGRPVIAWVTIPFQFRLQS